MAQVDDNPTPDGLNDVPQVPTSPLPQVPVDDNPSVSDRENSTTSTTTTTLRPTATPTNSTFSNAVVGRTTGMIGLTAIFAAFLF